MTGLEIVSTIRRYWPQINVVSLATRGNIIVMDAQYCPVSEDDIKRKWYELWLKSGYSKESWDCDDMAFQEMLRVRKKCKAKDMSMAIGVAGGMFANCDIKGGHAINLLVKPDLTVKLWDYQTETFFEPHKDDLISWIVI